MEDIGEGKGVNVRKMTTEDVNVNNMAKKGEVERVSWEGRVGLESNIKV